VGGRTVNVKEGSKSYNKYKAQGAAFGAQDVGRSNYLKSLNDPSSSNYVDPETGMQGDRSFYEQNQQLAQQLADFQAQQAKALKGQERQAFLQKTSTGQETSNLLASGLPSPENTGATPYTGSADALGGVQTALSRSQQMLPGLTPQQRQQLSQALGGLGGALERYRGAFRQGAPAGTDLDSPGSARGAVQGALPATQEPTTVDYMAQAAATDPFFTQMMTTWQEEMSDRNQRQSLTSVYQSLMQNSGLQALDTELMDMKKVIEGTEDDLRNEITKAGGFATESQVLALTNSRNKQLVKNYNTLLETRNQKEQYVNTLIGLEQQDRRDADSRFDQMMNFSFKMMDYRDKMADNARNAYNKIVDKVGYNGLLEMAGGDPYYESMIEQTMGFGQGGLKQLASLPLGEEEQLNLDIKRAQLANLRADTRTAGAPTIKEINGTNYQWNAETRSWEPLQLGGTPTSVGQLAPIESNITLMGEILDDKSLSGAVGPFSIARFSANIGGKQDFIATVEQLRSQLTLDSLVNAKERGATFGALSDSELRVLSASASKLGTWAIENQDGNIIGYKAQEKNFRKELDKIRNFARLDYILKGGDPTNVGAQLQPDGSVWAVNHDGTYTKLY
jgi:hypothetical protein